MLSRKARRCSNWRRAAPGLLMRGIPRCAHRAGEDRFPPMPGHSRVSGHRPWRAAGAAGDPLDGWRQLWCLNWVSTFDGVVEDHSVGVIDHLGFVAELHRFAQPTLADWAGIDIMQAEHDHNEPTPESAVLGLSRGLGRTGPAASRVRRAAPHAAASFTTRLSPRSLT